MLRKAALLTLIAMSASVFASDAGTKPAVQARQRMEAEAHSTTVATVSEEHPVSNVGYTRNGTEFVTVYESQANSGTKPAVQARQRMEANGQTQVMVAQEEHPVANVGYQRTVNAVYETYEPQPWNNSGTKPAVRARQGK